MERYRIVRDFMQDELVRSVNELIDDGWVPCGGISVCEDGDEFLWAQAMILGQVATAIRAADLPALADEMDSTVFEGMLDLLLATETANGQAARAAELRDKE
jgi:hypothetical protein